MDLFLIPDAVNPVQGLHTVNIRDCSLKTCILVTGTSRTETLDLLPTDRIVNENNKIRFRAMSPAQRLRIVNVPSVITVYSAEEGKMKRLQKFTIYRY